MRRMILVVNSALLAITINIGQLIDGDSVSLIKWSSMESLDGGQALLWGFVLDKCKPEALDERESNWRIALPFGHIGRVDRHEHRVILDFAHRVELLG